MMPFGHYGIINIQDSPELFNFFRATEAPKTGFLIAPQDLTENEVRAQLEVAGLPQAEMDSRIQEARSAYEIENQEQLSAPTHS
jgi:hypothetical protein